MSKLTRIAPHLLLTMALAIFASTPVLSQESTLGNQNTVLTFVHDFLQAFYPEVVGKGLRLTLSVAHPMDVSWKEISGVYFRLTPLAPSLPSLVDPEQRAKAEGPVNPTLLGGFFWLHPRERVRIEQMVASSEIVHEKELNAVRVLVESHPEWPDDRAIRALKEAGARYGPADKEKFIASLHFERAEQFLGRLSIKLVEFEGVSSDHVGNFARFIWIVHAVGEFPDGTRQTYGLSFEPFEGKLTGLSEISDQSGT